MFQNVFSLKNHTAKITKSQKIDLLTAAQTNAEEGYRSNWFLIGRTGLQIIAMVLLLGLFGLSCGRTPSRYLGRNQAQTLEVANMTQFISISFDTRGSSTVKDVTFLANDGYVYTQEFKDISPLDGMIRWVPNGQDDSFIQSRSISRWLGKPVNLQLPEDCEQILGVDVTYASKDERVKNLTFRAKDGRILSREYREGFIDRHFSGWLEIKQKP